MSLFYSIQYSIYILWCVFVQKCRTTICKVHLMFSEQLNFEITQCAKEKMAKGESIRFFSLWFYM